MTTSETLLRAHALARAAESANRRGALRLHDDELLHLMREHRWALTVLSRRPRDAAVESALNAAVLLAHRALHPPTPSPRPLLRETRWRLAKEWALSAGVFFGVFLIVLIAVLHEPLLAYDLIPSSLLLQIDQHAWGERTHAGADLGMTLFYWANNLRVSLLALGLGVLGGVLALVAVGYNGALMGAILGAALERGVGERLLAWVAPHGVPELVALIMCGGLGMALGRAWLRPGPLPRTTALARCSRDIVQPLLFALLLVVAAAPLEGFVAPLSLPWELDLGIALLWGLLLLACAYRWLSPSPSQRPQTQSTNLP